MGELPSSKWSRGVAWLGDRVVTEAQNAALPNTFELEGDIGWEGQSRLFSVHFQTSILVPFMQHRCVSAALTFSFLPHMYPALRWWNESVAGEPVVLTWFSQHSREPFLYTALQLLHWWQLNHHSAELCQPNAIICI